MSFSDECYEVIGVCMKVHSALGIGFHEVVYKDALEIEFKQLNIPYARECNYQITYEGEFLKHSFTVDFLVFGCVILEIKAVGEFHPDHKKQILNYLKAARVGVGLLINFGESELKFKRAIWSEYL
ncbi:MAG: GxxExxY protein [Chitinophagaceae bacterium]|nr:GxxExxY protein [Chitinophagaceae bacterium]